MATAHRLEVRYPNRRAVLASARTERAVLSLFVPAAEHVTAGDEVQLIISVDGSTLRFELEGRVRLQFQQTGARGPGLGVVFRGEQRKGATQMLAACAGTGADALDARREVDVRCLINLHGDRLRGALKDVSSSGAFIATRLVPGLRGEAELTIQLEPLFGRWGGRQLKARVVWVGEKHGVHGLGVQFLEPGEAVRDSLEKHLSPPP